MSSAPELILHVGAGKCGSTAIQNSLHNARYELRREGILYHPVGNNGHFLYKTLFDKEVRGDSVKAKKSVEKNMAEIRELIDYQSPAFVVFSAESFMHKDPDALLTLIRTIVGYISKVHIVAYVRCPAPHYLSQIQQEIKGSQYFTPPEKYNWPLVGRLHEWKVHPEVATITVRNFSRDKLRGASVVHDFAEILRRITGLAPTLPDTEANTSLSAEQMITLQRYRREWLVHQEGRLHKDSHRLIRFFEDLNRISGLVGRKPELHPEVMSVIYRKHKRKVEALNREFPGLDMDCTGVSADSSNRVGQQGDNAEIGSVLARYDHEVVEVLETSIPRNHPAFDASTMRDSEDRLQRIGISDEGVALYRDWITSVGYGGIVRGNSGRRFVNSSMDVATRGYARVRDYLRARLTGK